MNSLETLRCLLRDASLQCDVSTDRDFITIKSRFENEGWSFLTITLPTYTSWLEQSLEEGRLSSSIYSSFRRKKKSTSPLFLNGLVEKVFDAESGVLRSDADPTAVFMIRQICSFHKKVKGSCTKVRNSEAILKFEQTDSVLPEQIELDNVCRSVAYIVLDSLNFLDSHELCLPRHGPGATVEKLWGNQKFSSRDFYRRWAGIFDPIDLYGVAIHRQLDRFRIIDPGDERPCRLVLVPKTMKTPRIIAKEPVAMQYAQQYVNSRLISGMASSPFTCHIDFSRQENNRRLAKEGATHGQWATIDLSEASDRVSIALVKELYSSQSELRDMLLACRSTKCVLPGGRVLQLKKYSTSGSALTFPTETLTFFILALSALVKYKIRPREDLITAVRRLSHSVQVYGDDIVVPSDSCSIVTDYLETMSLKVNRGKTFSRGLFRESCGGDYFKGYDVTPKYLRQDLRLLTKCSGGIASVVSTSNQLFMAGCWHAADALRRVVDSYHRLPLVEETSPGVGYTNFRPTHDVHRISKTGEYLVRTLVIRAKSKSNPIDSYDALLKHHLSSDVQEDPSHLLRSVPKYESSASFKWVTPY